MPVGATAGVADISTYFTTSSRDENDKANKIRENVLKLMSNVPVAYVNDAQYGAMWITVRDAWSQALAQIAVATGVPPYTSVKTSMRGGRGYNYDADISYYNGDKVVGSAMIEFKNGGTNIDGLPQFLSLQAKAALFSDAETYDVFYYKNYLDKYLAVDSGVTEAKPDLSTYLNQVTKTSYSVSPWFAQLKAREFIHQTEKNAVVNASITDYLRRYGAGIDIAAFSQKIRATQTGKIYLLWSNGVFYVDKLAADEMTDIVYKGIKNGNVLELQARNGTIYGLLLRWRNHKGILNPAWQISMKRPRS
jgi:hypothetical protein